MKYNVSKQFFPFSCFKPPIGERFLAMAVPHMKPPRCLYHDKALDVSRHEITSYDGEAIECFLISPKDVGESAP